MQQDATTVMRYRDGRVVVDLAKQQLSVGGRPEALGGRAWALLAALVEQRGRTCSSEQLMARVRPGRVVGENTCMCR